jgi:hypothetical protein
MLNEEPTLDDIQDDILEELLSTSQQYKLVIKRLRLYGSQCMNR